jgi:hypothetical protein
MSKINMYNYLHRSVKKSSTNTKKNVIVNTLVAAGNFGVGLVKGLKPSAFEALPSVAYFMNAKAPLKYIAKGTFSKAGYAGIAYGLYDAGGDLVQGKLVGAIIDVFSCGASAVAGYALRLGGAAVITAVGAVGFPAILIGGAAIGIGIVISVGINAIADGVKNRYYRGNIIEKQHERYRSIISCYRHDTI